MSLTSTEIVAWWGAILATVVLVWDIIKWRRSGPRLRLTVRPNSYYEDSEQVLVKDDGKGSKEFSVKPPIHVELANVGSQPTTIMRIESKKHTRGGGWSSYDGSRFQEHFGKKLPYKLMPGDIWSCRVDQELLSKLPGNAPLEIHVTVSHSKKALVKNVAPSDIEPR